MVTDTSLMAYDELQPSLGRRQQEVLDVIRVFGPVSNEEIARHLHLPINCVTGRVHELREKHHLVKSDGIGYNVRGKRVHVWVAQY